MEPLTKTRVPVVGGLAYIERIRRQPPRFTATLIARPDARYFPYAIAVTAGGETLGYVAPEVARRYHALLSAAAPALNCPCRRGCASDHETSGVELLLDFSSFVAI